MQVFVMLTFAPLALNILVPGTESMNILQFVLFIKLLFKSGQSYYDILGMNSYYTNNDFSDTQSTWILWLFKPQIY